MAIPRAPEVDSTVALLSEGYRFIGNRCDRLNSNCFSARLMLRRVICARGPDAARMFYHPGRFTRQGAMPPTTLALLQDRGSVQMLDGDAHLQRKRMFLSLMGPERVRRATEIAVEEWRRALASWQQRASITLHDEALEIFCRAACRWAGIPYDDAEAAARTRECAAMIEYAGAFGPKHWKARRLRARTERWARDSVAAVRADRLQPPTDSALAVIAAHRGPDGELLSLAAAGVELINVVRPMVAVARYVTFCALALHEYPEWRRAIAAHDAGARYRFVQEARRYYPFFPAIGGRVREPFDWQGERFDEGAWVLLDLYGTNRSAEIWHEPDAFQPERFRDRPIGAYDLVAQGAGPFEEGHRCPGEDVTIALMDVAVRELVCAMDYEVPDQDLSVRLSRLPALPESGFVISAIRAARSAAVPPSPP